MTDFFEYQKSAFIRVYSSGRFPGRALGVKVDLTTKYAIKPNRWKYIKVDLIYV